MAEVCDWFFGTHACDEPLGHGPLRCDDGGHCAHRCLSPNPCTEVKPTDEGETGWLARQWVDDHWTAWRSYSAPFRLDENGWPPDGKPEAWGPLGEVFWRAVTGDEHG